MDFIFNGQPQGKVADRLAEHGFNPHALRPYLSDCGQYTCISVHNGKFNDDGTPQLVQKVIGNTTATLRKDAWKHLDTVVVKVAKERLKAVADLRSAGLTFSVPNGLGTTVLETETQSDIEPASVSMDGLRKNGNDRPVWELGFLPLPIVHKDFSYSARQIATAARSGSPLDTTSAELAARRVAEETEKLLLGVSTVADQFSFGNGVIYGYTDFPQRLTKTLTQPTGIASDGTTFLTEVLAMIKQSKDAFHYGPFILYVSTEWDQFLDADFKTNSDKTLRQRIMDLTDITDVRTLDFLANFDVVLVQQTTDVVRMVIGMDIVTVMWDTEGGLQKNFKVMSILVPQLRADQNGNTGIVHGTVA